MFVADLFLDKGCEVVGPVSPRDLLSVLALNYAKEALPTTHRLACSNVAPGMGQVPHEPESMSGGLCIVVSISGPLSELIVLRRFAAAPTPAVRQAGYRKMMPEFPSGCKTDGAWLGSSEGRGY